MASTTWNFSVLLSISRKITRQ